MKLGYVRNHTVAAPLKIIVFLSGTSPMHFASRPSYNYIYIWSVFGQRDTWWKWRKLVTELAEKFNLTYRVWGLLSIYIIEQLKVYSISTESIYLFCICAYEKHWDWFLEYVKNINFGTTNDNYDIATTTANRKMGRTPMKLYLLNKYISELWNDVFFQIDFL